MRSRKHLDHQRFSVGAAFALSFLAVVATVVIPGDSFASVNLTATEWVYQVRSPFLTAPLVALTYLGYLFWPIALSVAFVCYRRGQARLATFGLLLTAFEAISNLVAKRLVNADRPALVMPPAPLHQLYHYGFPSGHASGAVVVLGVAFFALAKLTRLPRFALGATYFLLVFGIGFSRVYLGVHWFGDVIGGYLYGAAILGIGWVAWQQTQAQRSPD